jgi:hypothetical protein
MSRKNCSLHRIGVKVHYYKIHMYVPKEKSALAGHNNYLSYRVTFCKTSILAERSRSKDRLTGEAIHFELHKTI